MSRYLDAGAVDVLSAPLTTDRMQGLAVHAYRRFKEASREDSSFVLAKRNRKLSWVGIDEERPYAYLREVMVSGLMNGICNPESVGDSIDPRCVMHVLLPEASMLNLFLQRTRYLSRAEICYRRGSRHLVIFCARFQLR